jgi:hypothetical protein
MKGGVYMFGGPKSDILKAVKRGDHSFVATSLNRMSQRERRRMARMADAHGYETVNVGYRSMTFTKRSAG